MGSEVDVATTTAEVAPAGSDAVLVSSTLPATWAPGERINVAVTMQNTGLASPTNDWPTNYLLYTRDFAWGWGTTTTGVTVAASPLQESVAMRQVLTAPTTAGANSFRAQMFAQGAEAGFFGQLVNIPVTIDPNKRREWACQLVSHNLPASLLPGQTYAASITVRNVGSRDWAAGGHCLISRDSPYVLWGSACPVLPTNVAGVPSGGVDADGGTATFNFTITAPATGSGPTPFRRQMYQSGSIPSGAVQFFSLVNNCVDTVINVGVPLAWNSAFNAAASDIDENTAWLPGERRTVTVAYNNLGSQTWNVNSTYNYARYSPLNLWGPRAAFSVLATTPSAQVGSFRMLLVAPTTEGAYAQQWRLYDSAAGFFGEQINIPVTVAAGAQAQYAATVVSQTLENPVTTLRPAVFRIRVRNTGFGTWQPSNVRLASVNSPSSLWSVGTVALTVPVPPGAEHEFVFTVRGPTPVGTYQSQWRMQEFVYGVGLFGETAASSVDVVAITCGNGSVEGSERCDDGNIASGDGCSALCQIENRSVDLSVAAADRTFVNDVGAREFGKVGIGDINGDGVNDVAMGSWASATPPNLPARAFAGRIHVYSGVGLFNGQTTVVGTDPNAMLTIIGAEADDRLSGQVEGRILIRDVTGDGFPDIVVSAAQASCLDNTGACGRVYVIAGGPQLDTVPDATIDLRSSPYVTARIIGTVDGDRTSIVSTGDLDNDGVEDLIVGMNKAAPLGRVDAGAVAIVRGGPTLTGTIAASGALNIISEIYGSAPGDRLGVVASVGQLDGVGGLDLALGASGHDSVTGGEDAGAVWVLASPLPATVDLATTWYARYRGAGIRDYLGSDAVVGDVTGDGNDDLVIGVPQTLDGGVRFGSVDIFPGPVASGADVDYSVGALPSIRFRAGDPSDWAGACLGVGDMTGDGVQDIVAVARFGQGAANNLNQAGEFYVLPGGATGGIEPGAGTRTISPGGEALTVYAGVDVARMCLYLGYVAMGDIDGDARDDVCVGSPQADVPGSGVFRPGRLDCFRSRW